jgi:hypothetical protein
MIRKDGRPFIMDFGIAREVQETMTRVTGKMSSGTLMYMSPEQLHGLEPKKSQDIYSFAAMVYECLTGKPPFYRGQIEYQIDHDEPKPLSEDFAIASSVMAGLAKNPEDRPKSCVAVLEGAYEKKEKERELGVRRQELGVGHQELGVSSQGSGVSSQELDRHGLKIATIGLLALGLIGVICFLPGKKESNVKFEVIGNNDKFEVIEDGMVQLWEGGPYWAAKNIGADEPEDPGYYFWWGDTVGYKREGGSWVASDESMSNFSFSHNNTMIKTHDKSISELEREGWIEKKNGTCVLTSRHDAARAHWKGAWRMPTKEEFDDLLSNCDWKWTTRNGKKGYVVRGRGNYASMSIFLPAAGSGNGASLYHSNGEYWSSVPMSNSDSECACLLNFIYSFICDTVYSARSTGLSVRPVQGFIK